MDHFQYYCRFGLFSEDLFVKKNYFKKYRLFFLKNRGQIIYRVSWVAKKLSVEKFWKFWIFLEKYLCFENFDFFASDPTQSKIWKITQKNQHFQNISIFPKKTKISKIFDAQLFRYSTQGTRIEDLVLRRTTHSDRRNPSFKTLFLGKRGVSLQNVQIVILQNFVFWKKRGFFANRCKTLVSEKYILRINLYQSYSMWLFPPCFQTDENKGG